MKTSTEESNGIKKQEGSNEFEIESIDNHRITPDGDRIEFLVRWKGYGDVDRTWESFEMFAYDAPDTAEEYLIKAFKMQGGQHNK